MELDIKATVLGVLLAMAFILVPPYLQQSHRGISSDDEVVAGHGGHGAHSDARVVSSDAVVRRLETEVKKLKLELADVRELVYTVVARLDHGDDVIPSRHAPATPEHATEAASKPSSTPPTPEELELARIAKLALEDPKKREWVPLPRPSQPTKPRLQYVTELPSRTHPDPFLMNGFNLTASDSLASNRPIQDTRETDCRKVTKWPRDLPTVSVIICFHNEARSTLYRTVRSVLDSTPAYLLDEIILVDDFSDDPQQGEIVLGMEKVRLLRNTKREGLIRSRVRGSNAAQSDVLTFLDSHCECNKHWLEPMLVRIKEDHTRIVAPVIDVIKWEDFSYLQSTANLRGGFSWNMQYQWHPESQPRASLADPIRTPIISGGLFSISKAWFDEIGQYDLQMETWGGENFELSFRVWQCGGKLEILPCSRIGHVYRLKTPYAFPGGDPRDTIDRNLARVAEVWLDDYKQYYYAFHPNAHNLDLGDLTDRHALRKRLQCKPFQWYIDNVFPEIPLLGENMHEYGRVKQNTWCIDSQWHEPPGTVAVEPCINGDREAQEWFLTMENELKYVTGKGPAYCLDVAPPHQDLRLAECGSDTARFVYRDHHIKNIATGLCVDTIMMDPLVMRECTDVYSQLWNFSRSSQ